MTYCSDIANLFIVFTGQNDHYAVVNYLWRLSKIQLLTLGMALGINYGRLNAMQDSPLFSDELVNVWLQGVDGVGVPTWRTLIAALRQERVGQTILASTIARDKGIE